MKNEKLIEVRRELHRRAELSFEEHLTQNYICDILTSLNIEHQKVASTGVLAVIGSSNLPSIVLRADIDALPILEASGVEFSSLNQGVMHACGHDIHTSALIGAMALLKENPPQDRSIVAIFQPGEEVNPGGASIVLKEGVLDRFNVKAVVGQHCSPELAVGTVGYRQGEFMASTDEIHLKVKGVGGHAAQRELLKNPVRAAVELLFELDKIQPPSNESTQIPHLLSFGKVIAEGATNVIPSDVIIAGTFRTFNEEWRKECKTLINSISNKIAKKHDLKVEVNIGDGYPVVFNDKNLTHQAIEILSQFSTPVEIPRRMTAEDFGFYGERYPSLFLRLGVGTETRLHTAQFCPDEKAIPLGAKLLAELATKLRIDQ